MIILVFLGGKNTVEKRSKLVIKNTEFLMFVTELFIMTVNIFNIHLISKELLIHPNVCLLIYS